MTYPEAAQNRERQIYRRADKQVDPSSSSVPLHISIGVMAHNEAGRIASTLRSLLSQDLLRAKNSSDPAFPTAQVELRILANGCTDRTAQIAQQILTETTQTEHFSRLRWSVDVIEQPGKANAWNLFVHQLSHPEANYLFLVDADIELLGYHTLQSMVATLTQHPEACAAVDRPIKDIVLKTTSKTLPEKLSAALSHLSGKQFEKAAASEENTRASPTWLCGQLYCGRAATLRQLHLPISSLAEDGLLYQLLVTDGLRSPANPYRVILAPSAAHAFEAYTQLGLLLKHERWLIASNSANDLLLDRLYLRGLAGTEASQYIHRCNQENPFWFHELVAAEAQHRRWLIPRLILTRRFVSLSQKSLVKAILMLPVAIAAFLVDVWLAYLANRDLHRGIALKYWGKPGTVPASAEPNSQTLELTKTI